MRLLGMMSDAGGIGKLELHRDVLEARILLAHERRKRVRAAALLALIAVDVRRFADHDLPPCWKCTAGRRTRRRGGDRPSDIAIVGRKRLRVESHRAWTRSQNLP